MQNALHPLAWPLHRFGDCSLGSASAPNAQSLKPRRLPGRKGHGAKMR